MLKEQGEIARQHGERIVQLEGIDARLQGLDSRLQSVESCVQSMDSRFERIEARMGETVQLRDRISAIAVRLSALEAR